jgi:hypothetical protein
LGFTAMQEKKLVREGQEVMDMKKQMLKLMQDGSITFFILELTI